MDRPAWSLTRRLGLAETLRWTLCAGDGPEALGGSAATRGFRDRLSSSSELLWSSSRYVAITSLYFCPTSDS